MEPVTQAPETGVRGGGVLSQRPMDTGTGGLGRKNTEGARLLATSLFAVLAFEIALLALLYLRESLRIAGGYGLPLDDSWIHSHFARNLALGHDLVYNPGQHVSSTAVLYTLLLSLVFRVKLAPVFDAIALGLVLHMGSAWLVYATARRLSMHPWIAALCAMAFAAAHRLVWGALSGMEVPLYVFLVCLGIYAHVRWRTGAASAVSTASFALATLARPECAAFLPILVVDRAYHAWRLKTPARKIVASAVVHVLLFALILLPAVAFNLHYTGKPLPPAFYAKVFTAPTDWSPLRLLLARATSLPRCLGHIVESAWNANPPLALAAPVGMTLCLLGQRVRKLPPLLLLPLSFVLVPTAAILGAPDQPAGHQIVMQNGRYSAYLVPLAVLMGGMGWSWVMAVVTGWSTRLGAAAWAIPPALIIASLLYAVPCNRAGATSYARSVNDINRMQVAIGKWAARLPKGAVLAVNDAGAIAYFSGHRILDTVGVVNPEVVPYLRRYPDRQGGLLQYLQERRPDYLIIFPVWYYDISRMDDLFVPVKTITLPDNTICGADTMTVYKARWE